MSLALDAGAAALAWHNAFLATSGEESRQLLYRTLNVEFFSDGVQFVATDGVLLFRTWVPAWQEETNWPWATRLPKYSVVLMDRDHFALSFIKTLMAATKELHVTLTLAIEEAPTRGEGEQALGDEFSAFVLTLRALGQQLHCKLFEAPYPNWRGLDLGLALSDYLPGMTFSPKVMQTLGKVKGATGFDFEFTGEATHCNLTEKSDTVRGLVMPMRRAEKRKAHEADQQIPLEPESEPESEASSVREAWAREQDYREAAAGERWDDATANGKVKLAGKWVQATPENIARAAAVGAPSGRDRAAGVDR